MIAIYAVLGLVAFVLSLGFNSPLYSWLFEHLALFRGLRAPARFSILAFASLAVIAGCGVDQLQRWYPASRSAIAVLAVILVALECGSAPMRLEDVPTRTPEVYRFIKQLSPGALVELPTPVPPALAGVESTYSFWSTTHWKPLVNGYSGYTTAAYLDTMMQMLTFPDDRSIARLEELGVRYVLVHEILFKPQELTTLLLEIGNRPELIPKGRYRDWGGPADLFELQR